MTIAPAVPDQRAWLDLLTGPDAGGLLDAALGADGAALGTWRVHQVHARPGAEVTVGYDVVARRTVPARPGGAVATVDATAYLLATTAPLPPDALGPGVARLEDGPRVVHVWRHPADPALPALAAACDAPGLTRRLDDAGVLAPGESVESVAMVAYRPLRRAVLRVRTPSRTLYVKVVRPGRARALARRHDLLQDGAVRAPRCLARDDDGLVVLEEARGPSLAQHLAASGPAAQPDAIDPRELLRALDALPERATTLRRRPAWAERVEHYATSALAVHGLDAERVRRVARAVGDAVATRDPGPVVATHGDFYEANVLLAAGADADVPGATDRPRVAALLDVDTLGPGHRVDDLACLVGHLAVLPALAPTVYGGVDGLVERCLVVFGTAVDPVGLRARAAGVVLSLVPGAGSRELAEAWLAVADGLLPLPESTLMTTSSASHA
ncbi:aminoglycoside phosphotransferase family protein [Cellulosimicrobium sp. JZ28]|uniref:aminoglycoside phosphotransferase family protein n=1 Tax=Cellulosimicrobium sp. JZ28 TaxID=1906273 RepID=UPI00188D8495|nr:aminoglycoside phosphotransferase family protein [Cellulosimicrobium sp. JZ28]